MLKISDILKKAKKKPAEQQSELSRPKPQPLPQQAEQKKIKEEAPAQRIPAQPRPAAPEKKTKQPQAYPDKKFSSPALDSEYISDYYLKSLSLSKEIMGPLVSDEEGLIKSVEEAVKFFIDILQKDETVLLRLFYHEYFNEDGHLYQHSVNVCILSVYLGMALRYSYAVLQQIGLAAFLHDVGLMKFETLVNLPRLLTSSEQHEIKKHPVVAKDFLKKFTQYLNFEIIDIIQQEHERINGAGYPYGLKKPEVSEAAQLIGIADIYEAMLHSRPYRNKLSSFEVIREILKSKELFDYKFVKVLIDTVGVFPLDAFVRLNTREVGVIVKQNPRMPLRPVIAITHNMQGQRLSEEKQIDLSANFSVYIQDSIAGSELK
ncbi:MAG: HD domain-containing protein [Candidatus Omnitrophica bacterium]|nr:HD domain-containing protein [Candidatus Omnitrophota bacterium]MBU4478678.1 HD domain-containing protein [Candidatus Omnitrophota bacterium]